MNKQNNLAASLLKDLVEEYGYPPRWEKKVRYLHYFQVTYVLMKYLRVLIPVLIRRGEKHAYSV